ncbi:MAG: AAA family ATPase, partial [Veillonella nakazawae]
MKPISLTIEAFGPYRDSVTLDFNELQNHSMFLISGPTGAGKTSILDAMVYALYGEPSGEVRKTDAIRSDFAEPQHMTRVDFSFAIGEARYRVERLPKQLVAKKRGTGMREQNASATVYEMKDGEWSVIATSAAAIRDTVQRIIGFRKDQFLQVVLLPQGEFRKLLVASTSEREELLHTLFRTELYRRLQDALKAAYDEAKSGIEENIMKQTALLQSIQHDEETPILTIEHVRDLLKHREPQRDTLVVERDKAVAVVERFNALRNEWALYNQAQQSLTGATNKLDLVKAREEERASLHKKVQFLTGLTPSYELYKQLSDKQATLKTLETALSDAKKGVDVATQHESKCTAAYGMLESQAETMQAKRTTLAQLQQQAEQFTELSVLNKELSTLNSQLETQDREKSEAKLQAQHKLVADLEAELVEVRKQFQDNSKELESIPHIQEQLSQLQRYSELVADKQKAQNDIDAKERSLATLDESVKNSKVQLERLEHLMAEGRAFELVHLVVDNEPCPVCGATEHPQLASKPELYPNKEEIEEARAVRDLELQKRASEIGQKETLSVRLHELDEQVKDQVSKLTSSIAEFSEDAFDSIHQDLLSQIDQLTALRSDTEQLSEIITKNEHDLIEAKDTLSKLEIGHNELLNNLHDLEVQISSVQAKIDGLAKTLPTTDLEAWHKQIELLETEIKEYDEHVKVCKTNLDVAREQLNTKRGRLETLSAQAQVETKHIDLLHKEYTKSLESISLIENDFIDALGDYKALDAFRTKLHALDEAFSS